MSNHSSESTFHDDWPRYNALLVARGDYRELITVVRQWVCLLDEDNQMKEGCLFQYPNALFQIVGKLYYKSGRGLRWIQGFLEFLSELLHFPVPTYSTNSRRLHTLSISILKPRSYQLKNQPQECGIDSIGIKVKGSGECLMNKHKPKTRQIFTKLHIVCQNSPHEILTQFITKGYAQEKRLISFYFNQYMRELKYY